MEVVDKKLLDATLAKNAELVVQVEGLKAAARQLIHNLAYANSFSPTLKSIAELERALVKTPTQHLRDIQAEADEFLAAKRQEGE